MKRCEKCKVQVAGERKNCPLCQGPLSGESDGSREVFPKIPTIYKQYSLFFRILILVSIIAAVISVTINFMIPESGWWSVFVVAGIGCMWLSLAFSVRKRRNIPKNMLYQVVILSLVSALWDWLTGWHGWSVDYVVPIVCVAAMIAMAIVAQVMHLDISDLMIYFCIGALFGIVPLVFYFTGSLTVIYPSLICVAGSIISLAALMVFQGRAMRAELRRRLHL